MDFSGPPWRKEGSPCLFWSDGHCGRDQTSILEGDGPDIETQERHFLTHPTSLSPFLLSFLSHKISPLPTAKTFSPSAHNCLLFISFHKGGKTFCWIFCPQMERKRHPSLSASLRHLVSKAFLQQPFQRPLLCLLWSQDPFLCYKREGDWLG